jgi:hypothetical protein
MLAKVRKRTGYDLEDTERWKGQCLKVASWMVTEGVVEGRHVQGSWCGEVAAADRDRFDAAAVERRRVGHVWIVLDADGRIMDPTRWVFEGVAPYIYISAQPAQLETAEYLPAG